MKDPKVSAETHHEGAQRRLAEVTERIERAKARLASANEDSTAAATGLDHLAAVHRVATRDAKSAAEVAATFRRDGLAFYRLKEDVHCHQTYLKGNQVIALDERHPPSRAFGLIADETQTVGAKLVPSDPLCRFCTTAEAA